MPKFLSLPKKSELPKIWGGCSPPRPPGPYAYVYHELRHCIDCIQLTTLFLKSGDVKLMSSRRSSSCRHDVMTIAKQRNKQSFLRLETRPDDAGFKFVSLKVLQFKVKERCKFLIGSILKKKKNHYLTETNQNQNQRR